MFRILQSGVILFILYIPVWFRFNRVRIKEKIWIFDKRTMLSRVVYTP
jgi:hypothetical protein